MSTYSQWQTANNRYLSERLADLRSRLERLAAVPAAVVSAPPATPWWERLFTRVAGEDTVTATAPAAATAVVVDEDSIPALLLLARRLGLSDFERDVLLLCAAMELDTRFALLCAQAQHDPAKPFPTFALAMALLDTPAWDAMSPERPLRYWRLIEIGQQAAQPLVVSPLRADERIVSYLKGANYLDDRVAPLVTALGRHEVDLPPSQRAVADTIRQHLSATSDRAQVVELLGMDPASKQVVATQLASDLGLHLYRIDAESMPATFPEQDVFLRLWQRECTLLPLALFVDAFDVDRLGPVGIALQRGLSRARGLVLLDVREPWPDIDADIVSADVAKPTTAEQRLLWAHALGEERAAAAGRCAVHFDLDAITIHRVAHGALGVAGDDVVTLAAALWRQCLASSRPVLDQLAQPVAVKACWSDLELPEGEKALLRQIADQAEHRGTVYDDWGFRERMNRGLGISVLFAGESGTGKSMAAEVLANALGLRLYRIDLSAVVNKYIGETEKNLRRLFDAAEGGGAILLFDEADALFGKRGEVKDSHDRYSNIEVNYLLQRMEAFRGLAILATNMKSALDQAFLRRLRFIVRFPFPGAEQREAIWRKALPPALDTGDIDHARLARFNLTGASIHSIALNAAFLAARAHRPIGMAMLLEAARAEFRKLEKPVNEADFRWSDNVERVT